MLGLKRLPTMYVFVEKYEKCRHFSVGKKPHLEIRHCTIFLVCSGDTSLHDILGFVAMEIRHCKIFLVSSQWRYRIARYSWFAMEIRHCMIFLVSSQWRYGIARYSSWLQYVSVVLTQVLRSPFRLQYNHTSYDINTRRSLVVHHLGSRFPTLHICLV